MTLLGHRRKAAAALTGCLFVLLLFLVPRASAGHSIDWSYGFASPTVTVSVGGKPFRLSVSGGRQKVLSSPTKGFDADGIPYSGLGFTVDQADPELDPPTLGQVVNGPLVSTPVRYHATRILSVGNLRVGNRTSVNRITLATNDPSGRKMLLDIGLDKPGQAALAVSVTGARNVTAVSASFKSAPGESFHGFGGRRESTDLRGVDMKSWVLDYRFPDASTGWYSPYPGFISSRNYGFLLGGDRISRWRMASDSPRAWRVSKPGSKMSMTVFTGSLNKIEGGMTKVTGRHRLPPKWSTGPMLSRTIGILTDRGDVYENKVRADVDRILQGDVPVSSYGFEGWAGLPPDFVREQVKRLQAKNIRTFLYLRSFVSNDTAGTELPGAYDEVLNKGLAATDADGKTYLFPSPFPGGQAAIIDFTNPAAVRWWKHRVYGLLDTGAEGFMNDFGEQVVEGMHFHDGSSAASMHNRYPVLQAKVTREAVDAWMKKHPKHDVFFFQRAGFSGRPGSAAYANAEFPGDETVDWQAGTGLPSIVPDMLNRAVTGSVGFSTDIGGYAQFTKENPILPPTSAELFTRWSQASAFMPFFRVHNSGLDGARMPWDFDAVTLKRWTAMADLHDRARPLFRKLWKKFENMGVPMTLPLWFENPQLADDPHANDEWQVGEDLLVAPVLTEGATSRQVTFPGGCWRLHGKGPKLHRKTTVAAPLGVLPWFTRCGTRPLAS